LPLLDRRHRGLRHLFGGREVDVSQVDLLQALHNLRAKQLHAHLVHHLQ
jgi:hypothetical protein